MDVGELVEAVVAKDTEKVRAALAAEPALARAHERGLGSTALHFAVHRGLRDIVDALLDAGADPDAREAVSDATPLHWAAEAGHAELARLLLARGASLEATDGWFGLTPLGWATVVDWNKEFRADRPATVKVLLAAGARHDVFTAVAMGLHETVRALVDADRAALAGRMGFVHGEMEPLHLAAMARRPEMVELLVELGADVRAATTWGLTPLALAKRAEDEASAARLRAAGAADDVACAVLADDAAAVTERLQGERPPSGLIFTAARDGRARALAALLAAGGDASARLRSLIGETPALATPLQLAAGAGGIDAVRLLLAHGADPSAGAGEGLPTPLHLAALGGHGAVVEALVAAGADRGARERSYGATPRGWAEHGGHAEIAALL